MIQRGQDGIQRRTLEPCPYQDCQQGVVKGMLGSLAECHQCNGLGFVDEESGGSVAGKRNYKAASDQAG